MPSNASNQFSNLIAYVDQLITAHGKIQSGRGRRHEQEAIHRAGVVLVVAAWESYVETVLKEAFASVVASAAGGPSWASHILKLKEAEVKKAAGEFNTPNAENVQRMFKAALDFDPIPAWKWRAPQRNWNSNQMKERLNAWVRIRHSVAHGGELPNNITWIQAPTTHKPRLHLPLLKDCKAFFEHVVDQTDQAFRSWLINHHGVAAPW
jgi:hypothetical protein